MTKANEEDFMPLGELAAMVFNSKFDTMKDELTAADLALYLWQEAEIVNKSAAAESLGVWLAPIGARVFINAPAISAQLTGDVLFKPLLRPLSDLKEDEACKIWATEFGTAHTREISSHNTALDWWNDRMRNAEQMVIDPIIGEAIHWRYLLSIGIDLFGWIEAGLAIDKTKIEQL